MEIEKIINMCRFPSQAVEKIIQNLINEIESWQDKVLVSPDLFNLLQASPLITYVPQTGHLEVKGVDNTIILCERLNDFDYEIELLT